MVAAAASAAAATSNVHSYYAYYMQLYSDIAFMHLLQRAYDKTQSYIIIVILYNVESGLRHSVANKLLLLVTLLKEGISWGCPVS